MTDPALDHDLAVLLHGAADEAPLPHHDLVTRSARRGAVRRGLRMGASVTAVIAVAAVGSVTVLALAGGPDAPTTQVAADPAPTAPPTTAPTDPSATDQSSTPPEWTPPPRGDRSDVAVFSDVVGEVSRGVGVLSDAASYPYGYRGIRSVSGVLTDAVGPARVQVAVTTQDPSQPGIFLVPEAAKECARKSDTPAEGVECLEEAGLTLATAPTGLSCATQAIRGWECRELPDGGVLRWGVERTYTDERDQGEYSNSATLLQADGLVVNVYAFNGAGEKLGVSRATPPLDLAAVKEIALDPRWADVDLAG